MKKSLFRTDDGTNHLVTFALVSSLFLLWGFCNGMIDVMDKHFQDQLHLTKAQSAWVQFAHYIGYAIMALPAGLLTRRLGYKGGIIAGLLLVSLGGFWFLPATSISQFWAFLVGVCTIAMGLTILETVANPYTTVLGPKEYGATRINLAQSCNGVGWILGPIVGSMYFYSESGVQKAHGQLYIPYVGIAIGVLVLVALFWRAPVPEIHVPDEYHTDDATPVKKPGNPLLIGLMMMLNIAAIALSVYLVLHTILPACGIGEQAVEAKWWLFALPVLMITPLVLTSARKISAHSIWAHPHFSGATLAQFVYVAAQAGIFSAELADLSALTTALKNKANPVANFIVENLSADTRKLLQEGVPQAALQAALAPDLNSILRKDRNTPALYDAQRFTGVSLGASTQKLLTEDSPSDNTRLRLNRMLLADAFPKALPYDDTRFALSDKGAGMLSSIAFGFFLVGRLIGAGLMRKTAAHTTLGLFALINVGVCGLIIAKLGWISVLSVFLSYLFMSIMYPTIFALGIAGLGSQSKKKAAAFIVMSITGGALMPKFMGHLGDIYNMSASFWMPLACFVFIACYGFFWRNLSRSEGINTSAINSGH